MNSVCFAHGIYIPPVHPSSLNKGLGYAVGISLVPHREEKRIYQHYFPARKMKQETGHVI